MPNDQTFLNSNSEDNNGQNLNSQDFNFSGDNLNDIQNQNKEENISSIPNQESSYSDIPTPDNTNPPSSPQSDLSSFQQNNLQQPNNSNWQASGNFNQQPPVTTPQIQTPPTPSTQENNLSFSGGINKKIDLKKIIFILLGLIILIIVGYFGFLYITDPTRGYTLPATTEEQKNKLKQNADQNLNYDNVAPNPPSFNGKVVNWKGKIGKVESGNGYTAWDMYTKAETSEGMVICVYYGSLDIKEDDYLDVYGVLTRKVKKSINLVQYTDKPIAVVGIVEKIDRNKAVAPTKKTWTIEKSQSKYNFIVTLEKIEFADNETRVYLKLENKSPYKVNLYQDEIKIIQGGSQIKSKVVPLENEKERLPNDILSNTEESGILYFNQSDYTKPLTITIKANSYSEDYSVSNKMTFTFKLNPSE